MSICVLKIKILKTFFSSMSLYMQKNQSLPDQRILKSDWPPEMSEKQKT